MSLDDVIELTSLKALPVSQEPKTIFYLNVVQSAVLSSVVACFDDALGLVQLSYKVKYVAVKANVGLGRAALSASAFSKRYIVNVFVSRVLPSSSIGTFLLLKLSNRLLKNRAKGPDENILTADGFEPSTSAYRCHLADLSPSSRRLSPTGCCGPWTARPFAGSSSETLSRRGRCTKLCLKEYLYLIPSA